MKPQQFSKDQIAEDTERQMRRRPQKYGAAMPDDDSGDAGLMPGGKAPGEKGPGTKLPANPEAAMAKPGEQASTPGENGQPHTLESACAKLETQGSEIEALKARLDALDGGKQQDDHAEPDQDDEGFGEAKY